MRHIFIALHNWFCHFFLSLVLHLMLVKTVSISIWCDNHVCHMALRLRVSSVVWIVESHCFDYSVAFANCSSICAVEYRQQHSLSSCWQSERMMSVSNLCCSICFECFDCSNTSAEDGNEFCVTSCGHFFHRKCINRWFLQRSNTMNRCPVCRQTITVGTVKRVYPQFIYSSNGIEDTEIERLRLENIQLSRQLTQLSGQLMALRTLRTAENLRNLNQSLNAVDANINDVSDCMFDIEMRIMNAESILLETESKLEISKLSHWIKFWKWNRIRFFSPLICNSTPPIKLNHEPLPALPQFTRTHLHSHRRLMASGCVRCHTCTVDTPRLRKYVNRSADEGIKYFQSPLNIEAATVHEHMRIQK